jgi:RNA polymerase sigma-70 factor, ECF subfamily
VQDLDGYHLLHASRGSMLERLGRPSEAAKAYDRAAALARTDADISFLSLRRTELSIDPREAPDE